MSTWLITGCSTGLGHALAEAAVAAGHYVVATARDVTKIDGLAGENVLLQPLDVTVPEQVAAAVRAGTQRFGQIDVLVNNAGYGYRAAVEEGRDEDVQALFAANFFGPIALIKEVLPQMRSRRSGSIVNLSSIGARLTPEGSGYYAAAKAAIEALSGSLRKELAPLGIAVMTVEPGFFRTDFSGRSLVESEIVIDDYAGTAGKRRKAQSNIDGTQRGDPVKGAEAIIAAVESADAPELFMLGPDAVEIVSGILTSQLDSIRKWSSLSSTTDFD